MTKNTEGMRGSSDPFYRTPSLKGTKRRDALMYEPVFRINQTVTYINVHKMVHHSTDRLHLLTDRLFILFRESV